MADRDRLRASDDDREEVVELLRTALDSGRLKVEEFNDRMGMALEAVTYGDLAALHTDLPPVGEIVVRKPRVSQEPVTTAQAVAETLRPRGVIADLPIALKVLWTIWFAAVSINVVVWVLLGATSGHVPYPWPLWVAGPSGAALFAVSSGVRQIKHNRHDHAVKKLPPAQS
jgi:hypothetical protein